SSFGLSGTNAHVILEEAPAAAEAAEVPQAPEDAGWSGSAVVLPGTAHAWLVSGRSAAGLSGQAERLRDWVDERPELQPADLAWSLAVTRSAFEHRAVVVGGDRTDLVNGLVSLASGTPSGAVVSAVARADTRPVFAFAGQGSQWVGMGRELAGVSPVFAARLA
ncbi:CurL C-terminal domain-containing protein, partial [Streptomyces sp. CA2R106]|uniref:CurL C-terminal domain-containing protein n=1 Tax=Streptomyces sp. CA2R106 TaxID=3120153 RepID=UPI00300AB17B